MRHGVRQVELAKRIGYEQSYLSALESGTKGPPTQEFVERLIVVLALSEDEASEVRYSVDESQRKLVIEATSRMDIYKLLRQLRHTIATLPPEDVEHLSNTISILTRGQAADAAAPQRILHPANLEARM